MAPRHNSWLVLVLVTCHLNTGAAGYVEDSRCFPEDFLFVSATASYQVEGGFNETGRTPSIWDGFCRQDSTRACANVADDFLHRYEQDIELMSQMGLTSFRLSISWSRVMTWNNATKQMERNEPGLAFYHALLNALNAKNIVPVVTLYHWDLPLALHQELTPSGWLNEEIVAHFVDYCALMFAEYGNKVRYWATFNEPWTFTVQGYGNGIHAPGMKDSVTNVYTATHHVLLAHAHAVRLFWSLRDQQQVREDAQISIVLNCDFGYPLDPENEQDVDAAERKMQFALGWYLSPLTNGDYPKMMKERAGDHLPIFTDEQSQLVQGTYDLLMLNHYSSKLIVDCDSDRSHRECSSLSDGWERDLGIDDSQIPPGARRASLNSRGEYNCGWFTGYPEGYLETIKWMHRHDPEAQILLTENGWCGNETVDNEDQLWYYQNYMKQVYIAIEEYDIPIIGYSAWSLLDNYEWGSFEPRFGLFYVDFPKEIGEHDPTFVPKPSDLKRIPRIAAKWFAKVAKSGCLVEMTHEDVGKVIDPLQAHHDLQLSLNADVDKLKVVDQNSIGMWRTSTLYSRVMTCVTLAFGILLCSFGMLLAKKYRLLRRQGQGNAGERMPLLSMSERRQLSAIEQAEQDYFNKYVL